MKKILLFLMMLLTLSATSSAQSYNRSGNTFSSSTVDRKNKQEAVKTKFTWKDSKGEYPIYISKNGSCFVIKNRAKDGKEYPKYLGAEISQQICKELNIEYKPKKTK